MMLLTVAALSSLHALINASSHIIIVLRQLPLAHFDLNIYWLPGKIIDKFQTIKPESLPDDILGDIILEK